MARPKKTVTPEVTKKVEVKKDRGIIETPKFDPSIPENKQRHLR
jgi:hypothetical protein